MKHSLIFIFICFFLQSYFIFAEESESTEIVIRFNLYTEEIPYKESQIFQQMEENPSFPHVEVKDVIHNELVARVTLHMNEPNVIVLPEGRYFFDIWRSKKWHILYTGLEEQGTPLDTEHQSFEIRYDPGRYTYADAPRRIEPNFQYIPLLMGTHRSGPGDIIANIYDANLGIRIDQKTISVSGDWHAIYYYTKSLFLLNNNEAHIDIEFVGNFSGMPFYEYHSMRVLCSAYNLPKLSGWFAGDCHVHTEFTDNFREFGIPADAIWTGGKYFGLDFAMCTDHSHDLDAADWTQLGTYAGNHSGFWILRGEEISAYAYGNPTPEPIDDASHYLAYNTSQLIYTGSWSNLYEYCDHQWVINTVNNLGGFGYIAHPFDPSYPWDNSYNGIDTFALEYTGIEIATYNLNNAAKNKWVELLQQGRHVYAIGNSDAHSLCNVGAYGGFRTYVYCPQGLNQQNILDALKAGHSVVSQGPLLTFSINGIPPGGMVTAARNTTLTLNIQGAVTPEWSDNGRIYLNLYYCTTDGSFTSEERIYLGDFYAQPSGYTTVGFNVSLLQNQNGYIRLEGHSTHYGTEKKVLTNPIWIQIPPQFNEISSLFALNSFHVVGDKAYCTDVLGTANVSWICGRKSMERPEGRTDKILQESESSSGNLLVTGGPAINPLAEEFGKVFGINYQYVENVSFTILCENQSLMLDLNQYPQRDIGIVYLGKQKGRSILLTWGYGWQGTYAATVLMSHPDLWGVYGNQHLLLLEWVDFNNDGLITWNEIRVVYPYHVSLSAPPSGSWWLDSPVFRNTAWLFGSNSFHVVGDAAYCTDVLGTANVSWLFGSNYGLHYMERPEGRTDTILTYMEHQTGNLLITGGPAVNPLAAEFGQLNYFNISYVFQQGDYFEISSDGCRLRLELEQYPQKDICIIHLGRQNNRNVLIIWGYGWQGTYAGTLAMATYWNIYLDYHMLLVEWTDANLDRLVQLSEIAIRCTGYGPHIV